MKLVVKTLKGGKFGIEVDESSSVAAVKGVIVSPINSCQMKKSTRTRSLW